MSGSTQIWFGTRAVDFVSAATANTGTGQQVENITSNADFDSRTFAWGTFDNAGAAYQQLVAFIGTAAAQSGLGIDLSNGVDAGLTNAVNTTGDLRLGTSAGGSVTAQNLADMIGGGRIGDVSGLNQTDDVVAIGGFSRVSNTAVGEAAVYDLLLGVNQGAFVSFSNALGFGLINRGGWDIAGNATRLNDGDSVDFNVASGNILNKVSFTVSVLNNGSAEVFLDSDGQVIKTVGGLFAQDASAGELSLGVLAHNTKVEIDYDFETITINGISFGGSTSSFFDTFVANGINNVTFGSKVVNTAGTGSQAAVGWSVDDLVLSFKADDGGGNPNVGGPVLSFDWFTAGVDPAPTGLLSDRLYAYFDEDANNTLDAAEVAGARTMGQMRRGDLPGDDGAGLDDNPVQGAGSVHWLEMYAIGAENPAFANGQPILSGAQYGEHIGGNVVTMAGDDGRFALSVNSSRNPAEITSGGPNGGPLDVDPGQSGTLNEFDRLEESFVNNGEILGFSLIAKDSAGTASFATGAKIAFAQGSDLTPASDVDMIVRLYNGSTLLETITYDITGVIGAEESAFFVVADNLGQNFNRMEIEAAGSMNGINVVDAGARFVITDLDFFLA